MRKRLVVVTQSTAARLDCYGASGRVDTVLGWKVGGSLVGVARDKHHIPQGILNRSVGNCSLREWSPEEVEQARW